MDAPKPTNSLAVVSLVCGIASWIGLPLIGSIAAVITGHLARGQIRERAGTEGGDGFALTGIILGYANLAFSCIGIVILILIFSGIIALASASH
jgi:hypothetical protein